MQNLVLDYSQLVIKLNKKRRLPIIQLIAIFVVLFILAFFLCKPLPKKITYYILNIDCFSTYQQALNLAGELQAKGAGGYIHFDDEKYFVFATVYKSKEDAESVLNNLNYKNISIKQVEIANSSKTELNDVLEQASSCVDSLINISIKFDKNELSRAEITPILSNLISSFKNVNKELTSKIPLTHFENIKSSLDIIKNSTEQDFSFTVKFHTLYILMNYSAFFSLF